MQFGSVSAPEFTVNPSGSITTYVPFKGSTDVSISVMTTKQSHPWEQRTSI